MSKGLFTLILISNQVFAQYKSTVVHYDDNNLLVYHSDKEGNRIPDFSHAGYKGGGLTFIQIVQLAENEDSYSDEDSNLEARVYQYRLKTVNDIGSSA